jgi:hypothetical protein
MAVPPEAICPGPAADPNTYEYVLCAARSLSHLFNKSTGRLMGEAASKADCSSNVRFSNRPFGVKHFQTIHQCGVDVARGLVVLFGIGTGAFPSWDSRTRRNNLLVGLAVEERRVQADIRTHLIHRPARDIFPPLGGARAFSYRV